MELVSLLVIAFAIAVVASSIAAIGRRAAASEPDTSLDEDGDTFLLGTLAERKEMVMQLILSAELDHDMGKISDDDRDRTITRLKREAVEIMKRMDDLRGSDEDVAQASQDLQRFLERDRDEAARKWSAAARLRHGGVPRSEAG